MWFRGLFSWPRTTSFITFFKNLFPGGFPWRLTHPERVANSSCSRTKVAFLIHYTHTAPAGNWRGRAARGEELLGSCKHSCFSSPFAVAKEKKVFCKGWERRRIFFFLITRIHNNNKSKPNFLKNPLRSFFRSHVLLSSHSFSTFN